MDDKKLIELLNNDLSYELSAVTQYVAYAAKVTGPYRRELAAFFEAEIPDELGHAQFLANKVVALGGEPETVAKPVPSAGNAKAMLEAVLKAERDAVARYTVRAQQAEEMGRKGLQVDLEDMIRDETSHAEQTERILRDWDM